MENRLNIEELEFVAECRETEERLAFSLTDLWGWDDETVFLDTRIYLNRPREREWPLIYQTMFGRELNPAYHIHIRTEEDGVVKEPLRLSSIKLYPGYRFEAEFTNHVVRTGSLEAAVQRYEEAFKEPPFHQEAFAQPRMTPKGIQTKNGLVIAAHEIWKMSDEYVHCGCSASDFRLDKFQEVKNRSFSTKPSGGFWASPGYSYERHRFGWEDFCRREEYRQGRYWCKFYFCLDCSAHIFKVKGPEDYHTLPKRKEVGRGEEFIDFQECYCQGIDAIEYDYTEAHRDQEIGDEMDFKMLGWDCDSILIMNPGIILRESFLTRKEDEKFWIKA